jgi:copper chaperone
METVTLKIDGMTCGGCVNSVRKVIAALNGVSSVDVSLEHAQATVSYDPKKSKVADLKTAVRDAGFETD